MDVRTRKLENLQKTLKNGDWTPITKNKGFSITESHLLALADLEDPKQVQKGLQVVLDDYLTADQANKLVESMKNGTPTSPRKASGISTPTGSSPKNTGTSSHSATPQTSMSETESLAWDAATGISVITQIKAKIKKGERPSFFEALLLLVHTLWKIGEWLVKHGYRIAKPTVKVIWKLLKESIKSVLKAFGPTVYRVTRTLVGIAFLAVCAYVAWDSYAHEFHPWHALCTLFTLGVALVRG